MSEPRPRFPGSVYRVSVEPDPRFSLANERTFLAWVRTALALMAIGVALETLALPLQPAIRLSASLVFLILGILTPVQAWCGWARTERAVRQGEPLPAPVLATPLAIGCTLGGLLVLVGLVLG